MKLLVFTILVLFVVAEEQCPGTKGPSFSSLAVQTPVVDLSQPMPTVSFLVGVSAAAGIESVYLTFTSSGFTFTAAEMSELTSSSVKVSGRLYADDPTGIFNFKSLIIKDRLGYAQKIDNLAHSFRTINGTSYSAPSIISLSMAAALIEPAKEAGAQAEPAAAAAALPSSAWNFSTSLLSLDLTSKAALLVLNMQVQTSGSGLGSASFTYECPSQPKYSLALTASALNFINGSLSNGLYQAFLLVHQNTYPCQYSLKTVVFNSASLRGVASPIVRSATTLGFPMPTLLISGSVMDTTAPELAEIGFSGDIVNATVNDDTNTLTVEAVDAKTRVVAITIEGSCGPQDYTIRLGLSDIFKGKFVTDVTIPKGSECTWTFESVVLRDAAGNTASYVEPNPKFAHTDFEVVCGPAEPEWVQPAWDKGDPSLNGWIAVMLIFTATAVVACLYYVKRHEAQMAQNLQMIDASHQPADVEMSNNN